jgi:UDP-N-acetylglucosamine 2-epimerase (non-hydrolysing)
VNSTLACALVASKLRHEHGCRIAHVEAGLRSDDWGMPEEVNRVLTDRLSDLLLIPSHDARAHLLREGIDARRIVFVGNVMIDSLLRMLPQAKALDVPGRLGLKKGGYVVATIHRPANVDEAAPLRVILDSLGDIGASMPVVLPLHPRTRDRVRSFNLDASLGIRLMEPMGYTEMLGLQSEAALVVTDSGGMQEESTVLGIPCVTLRETTERPVTVSSGTNRMAPWPLTREGIRSSVKAALDSGRVALGARSPEGWDGHAAERIIDALVRADSELRDGRARRMVSSVTARH